MENLYRGMSVASEGQYDTPQSSRGGPMSVAAAQHQRTYQACIPCRRRKVRCDLGSVDNPSDPPCVRCRRESKECYFSATRRKRKSENDEAQSDDEESVVEIKDGRKRPKTHVEYELPVEEVEDIPRTPGGSIGQNQPLRRPANSRPVQYNEEDQKASEQTVGLIQAAEVHSGHDALKLLLSAARKGSRESGPRPNLSGISPASQPSPASPMIDRANGSYNAGPMAMLQHDPIWKTNLGPTSNASDFGDMAGHKSAIKAWERFRFVRAGWFRATEAIDYIDYFFRHLAPLTPVDLNHFRPHSKHEELLTHEPMLTITMLLIASRHMKLSGPGMTSRPYSIHQKLWTYLSGMIDRVLWGQEQFGGGFCGAGGEPSCDVNPLTRRGLRTLGTIESLILLTEWHPRAMHFPPDEADDELMVPEEPHHSVDISENDGASKGIGGQRMDAWLEPCWRSDRMCWMLLGLSMSLAFEIGVFDSGEWQRHARSTDGSPLSAADLQRYDRRRGNVRNLLLVYVTSTSGRVGLTSMLPNNYSQPEDSPLFHQKLGQQQSVHEVDLHFWLRMAALMRDGSQKLYANKSYTRDLIKNGNYKAVLDQLQVPLYQWRADFDQCTAIPKYMRHILDIEYQYCRVYINALALQAVAERCSNVHLPQSSKVKTESASSAMANNEIRPDAIPPQTLAKLLGGDRQSMLEVGNAARDLLKVVVEGLYPGEYLKHAPVRTYFRIISASIMLLKSFSLGGTETAIMDSLQLVDKTVDALQSCVVDDVHVASRFADLLSQLTQNMKPRLYRIAADGRSSKSRRVSIPGSPGPESMHAPLGVANQKLQAHQRSISRQIPTQQDPNQRQWQYNNGSLGLVNGTNQNSSSNTLPSYDPFSGITNDIYDLTDQNNNFSVMPPPSFSWQSPTNSQLQHASPGGTMLQNMDFGDPLAEDWLAMDLGPIINSDVNQAVDITSTMYGPQIGENDMLELLLSGGQNGGF